MDNFKSIKNKNQKIYNANINNTLDINKKLNKISAINLENYNSKILQVLFDSGKIIAYPDYVRYTSRFNQGAIVTATITVDITSRMQIPEDIIPFVDFEIGFCSQDNKQFLNMKSDFTESWSSDYRIIKNSSNQIIFSGFTPPPYFTTDVITSEAIANYSINSDFFFAVPGGYKIHIYDPSTSSDLIFTFNEQHIGSYWPYISNKAFTYWTSQGYSIEKNPEGFPIQVTGPVLPIFTSQEVETPFWIKLTEGDEQSAPKWKINHSFGAVMSVPAMRLASTPYETYTLLAGYLGINTPTTKSFGTYRPATTLDESTTAMVKATLRNPLSWNKLDKFNSQVS